MPFRVCTFDHTIFAIETLKPVCSGNITAHTDFRTTGKTLAVDTKQNIDCRLSTFIGMQIDRTLTIYILRVTELDNLITDSRSSHTRQCRINSLHAVCVTYTAGELTDRYDDCINTVNLAYFGYLDPIAFKGTIRPILAPDEIVCDKRHLILYGDQPVLSGLIQRGSLYTTACLSDTQCTLHRADLLNKKLKNDHCFANNETVYLQFPFTLDILPQLPSMTGKSGHEVFDVFLYAVRQLTSCHFHRTKKSVELTVT